MTDPADDPRLLADWRDLYARVACASPFQSPDWLTAWWRAFHPGALRLVAVREGARLVALAPLYREVGPAGRRLLPLGISLSDDTDVLVDPARADAGARLVAAVAAGGDFDRWSLEDLLPGSAGLALPCPAGYADTRAAQSARPALSLAGPRDGDGLPLTVPADRRRKLRRARRLARERGGFEIRRDPPPEAFLAALERLHGARWAARGEAGLFADDRARAFHRGALLAMTQAGLARTALVSIGGTVAGAYYGLARGERALAYMGGFDPALAHDSPGAILIGDAVVRAVEDGMETFDFLRGREAYKYAWGAEDRWTMRREFHR